ncbi:MAG TPA: tail fiber domain-containing protein [Thermoanaerobaculia bacterium]|nr:tail fiber domain-containing protein [Thermoanaerobaculia bacterium]
MSMHPLRSRIAVLALALLPFSAFAADEIGKPTSGGSAFEWETKITGHESIKLTVIAPDGEAYVKEFGPGRNPSFRLTDLGGIAEDGQYTYELRVLPKISSDVKKRLSDARATNDDAAIRKIAKEAKLGRTLVQSGVMTVLNGSFVSTTGTEPGPNSAAAATAGAATSAFSTSSRIEAQNQVISNEDLIVQGSTCVGFDCAVDESFGFDTLKLKENTLRIFFEDSSASAGYPTNDWRLISNDQASGGANMFAIEDATAARRPFLIEAAAPASALYVDSTGNVGFSQSAPLLDLHVTTDNTPAMRLEQTSAGGFTAQTWDIGANEANFFVRDLTGGSRLPFRIRPGAPTSAVDIAADGDIGINTASPNANTRLDVSDSTQLKARIALTGQEFYQASNTSTDGVALILGANRANNRQLWIGDTAAMGQSSANRVIRFYPNVGDISAIATDGIAVKPLSLNGKGGNVGIGTFTSAFPLQVGDGGVADGNGAHVTTGGVWTNGSSRTFKENIEELTTEEAIAAVAALKPVRYNYIREKGEEYIGFIAEEVPELVAQTSEDRKYLSPMDIVATLTKVVQEQQKTVEEQRKTIEELSQRVESLEKKQ